MMGVRAQQKEKTRRSLVEAAFSQLSAERSFRQSQFTRSTRVKRALRQPHFIAISAMWMSLA
ncbi:TetR family transcriptional regulator [Citrobacter koseri]|uniref:TetR family transcriptional regulator n=1 Tax=Citrobacter koseri TaxID=545 RepID=A0A447UNV5_CITKO|nr:TetR family transcriptional regulator [Citrobacter koseri]